MPVVSICIATYNHAGFLPRCLDSILAQTFQDFEMVIVNDGSTDNTHQILMDYQERYPEKVRYFWHPGFANKGISATTNRAIQEASGKYIAFIGSDDTWHPEKLELQVALLEQHPEYGYVYSYAELIDEWDHVLPGLYGVDITHDSNPTGRMIIFCHQPAMTVVLKRNCLDEIEWFDESLVYGDWT
jgi:glycosyltransferase involved in cell wall biosynthesis